MEGSEQHEQHLHFGAFLKMHRDQRGVRQREVLFYLPGWTQANYSRLESGAIAPSFDQLLPIYSALLRAGVQWSAVERQRFLDLARARIEAKKRQSEQHSEQEWAELRYQMADVDFFPNEPAPSETRWTPPRPLLAETRHLLGREAWYSALAEAIQASVPKKLVVVQGPVGIGKSSALHWLIQHFISTTSPAYHVIWIPLLPVERGASPESSLDVVLGNVLAATGSPVSLADMPSLEQRQRLALALLEQSARPVVIVVDNAESVLAEEGQLAACWDEFLDRFLRHQHRATLIMATRAWPGWPGRNRALVYESAVPLLDQATSIRLLQQQGLEAVPLERLQEVWRRVGGIPLYLEWVASLVQHPHRLNRWQSFDLVEGSDNAAETGEEAAQAINRRLTRLLADSSLLRGHLAGKLRLLLARLIEKSLSPGARVLLETLSVCNVPLGKTALQSLCEHPGLINELRNASLLVPYAHRVQVLPVVAGVVTQGVAYERVGELEQCVIAGLQRWVDEGSIAIQEAGAVITEFATLLLKHHRLLEAAELLIRYGWLGFNQESAPQLAQLAEKAMGEFDWQESALMRCGGLILYYMLSPFLEGVIDAEIQLMEYQSILNAAKQGIIHLYPSVSGYIVSYIMLSFISTSNFEGAKTVLDETCSWLEVLHSSNADLHQYLLQLRAWLLGKWSDYTEEQGEKQLSQNLLTQTITIYRECIAFLLKNKERVLLEQSHVKMRLARCFNDLGYHLARNDQFEEALQFVECGIRLKEEGYVDFGTLASSYGEKAEILMELGRFQEAILYDEKALAETERYANAGHIASQEEIWTYLTNRGRLYLRLGRIEEAERLLQGAFPHIHGGRKIYRMFARDALQEIEQWRQTHSSHYQLDWRWVERYRELTAFDSYWWLAPAGPFSGEEQQQWHDLIRQTLDETTKHRASLLILQSRERELAMAMSEQREPRLHYPAIVIEEVRRRVAGLLQLDAEMCKQEPNAIVRRLYHGAIEEDLAFLHLIEATYEGNSERFWECNLVLNPLPTPEEMNYALARFKALLRRGLELPEAKEVSLQLLTFLREQLQLSLHIAQIKEELLEEPEGRAFSSFAQHQISAQSARGFFEAVLRQNGFTGWHVTIDPNASSARVEHGLRQVYLANKPLSLDEVREYLSHELAGHVGRCLAGENSKLGLLAIHTRNSLETEEGLAIYYDRRTAMQRGQTYDDTAIWTATLATGLASGIVTPPQTFRQVCTFFEYLYLLYQLVNYPWMNVQEAQNSAREYAFSICLRAYRGVPDLERRGISFTKDANYLRGLRKIEQVAAQEPDILNRLAVGVISLEVLPDMEELDVPSFLQPLRRLTTDPDLDIYILAFEQGEENSSVSI